MVAGLLRNPFLSVEQLLDIIERVQDVAEMRLEQACDRMGVSLRGLDDEGIRQRLAAAMVPGKASPTDLQAYELMNACIAARVHGDMGTYIRDRIIIALARLDDDLTERGRKFSQGRADDSIGPIRKFVRSALAKNPRMRNAELWEALKRKPPRGCAVMENRLGKYIEGPKPGDEMTHRTFLNVCSLERATLRNSRLSEPVKSGS